MPLLAGISAIFKAIMLFDALRKGGCCGNHWYLIIVLIPFGEWIYFFMVKIHDPEFAKIRRVLWERPPSLAQLQAQSTHCPSIANKHQYARGLYDHGMYTDAKKLYEELLSRDPSDKVLSLELALTERKLGLYKAAIERLAPLISSDRGFKDYLAMEEYVRAMWDSGDTTAALTQIETTAKQSGRLAHKVLHAKILTLNNQKDAAKAILTQAIADYKNAPRFAQRQERPALREGKRLLAQL